MWLQFVAFSFMLVNLIFALGLFSTLFFLKKPLLSKAGISKTTNLYLALAFIAGAFFATLLASFVEGFFFARADFFHRLNSLSQNFAKAFFVASCEELIKFLTFFSVAHFLVLNRNPKALNPEAQQNLQSALEVWAFVFAIFFATVENLFYSLSVSSNFSQRFLTATLLHIALSLFYPKIIFSKKNFLFLAVALHATYNFSTNYLPLFFTLGIACLIFATLQIVKFFRN